jgi:hypothetical protein
VNITAGEQLIGQNLAFRSVLAAIAKELLFKIGSVRALFLLLMATRARELQPRHKLS